MLEAIAQPEKLDAPREHPPRRRRRPLSGGVGQLNLTAMIDVIFLLLIYFVVTSNFRTDEGVLTATLPQGTGAPREATELPPQKIELRLTAGVVDDTTVAIQQGTTTFVTFAQLRDSLAAQRLDPEAGQPNGLFEPDNPIVIQAGPNVRWQHVVNAFNACLAARYTNISFAKPVS